MTYKQYWFSQSVGLLLMTIGAALAANTATGLHMMGLGLALVGLNTYVRLRMRNQLVSIKRSEHDSGSVSS